MTEDTKNALATARHALDAVIWLGHASSNQNAKFRHAGASQSFLDIPPESRATVLLLVGEKISIACKNLTLSDLL